MGNSSESKIIWITIAISVVAIIGVFVLLIASTPKPLSQEEKNDLLIREDSYVEGKTDAPVTIVTFEDIQCPACASYQPDFNKIKTQYGDQVKFVFRHFPLNAIHKNAYTAGLAAEAAGAQGKFYKFIDIMFTNQKKWEKMNKEELVNTMKEYAKEAGVEDLDRFVSDVNNATYASKVNRDFDDGEKLGVNATPTVFLNGKVVGNPSFEGLEALIKEVTGQ